MTIQARRFYRARACTSADPRCYNRRRSRDPLCPIRFAPTRSRADATPRRHRIATRRSSSCCSSASTTTSPPHYEHAINVWTRALFLDRSHARARAYIERARSALAERQRESEELLQNGVAAFQPRRRRRGAPAAAGGDRRRRAVRRGARRARSAEPPRDRAAAGRRRARSDRARRDEAPRAARRASAVDRRPGRVPACSASRSWRWRVCRGVARPARLALARRLVAERGARGPPRRRRSHAGRARIAAAAAAPRRDGARPRARRSPPAVTCATRWRRSNRFGRPTRRRPTPIGCAPTSSGSCSRLTAVPARRRADGETGGPAGSMKCPEVRLSRLRTRRPLPQLRLRLLAERSPASTPDLSLRSDPRTIESARRSLAGRRGDGRAAVGLAPDRTRRPDLDRVDRRSRRAAGTPRAVGTAPRESCRSSARRSPTTSRSSRRRRRRASRWRCAARRPKSPRVRSRAAAARADRSISRSMLTSAPPVAPRAAGALVGARDGAATERRGRRERRGDAGVGARLLAVVIDLRDPRARSTSSSSTSRCRSAASTIEDLGILPKGPLIAFLLVQNGGYLVAFTAGGQTLGKMAAGIRVVPRRLGRPARSRPRVPAHADVGRARRAGRSRLPDRALQPRSPRPPRSLRRHARRPRVGVSRLGRGS